jgi:hypothetical protein
MRPKLTLLQDRKGGVFRPQMSAPQTNTVVSMFQSLIATGGWLGLGIAPLVARKTDSGTLRFMIYLLSPPVTSFVLTAVFAILYGIGYFTNQVLTAMILPGNVTSVVANVSVVLVSFSGALTISDILYRMKQQTIDVAAASEAVEDDESDSTDAENVGENESTDAEDESTGEDESTEENELTGEDESTEENESTDETKNESTEETETATDEEESSQDWKKDADFEKARNAPPLTDNDDE